MRRLAACTVMLAACLCLSAGVGAAEQPAPSITGMVFLDGNSNGIQDAGENGIEGVAVSDGISIVLTDSGGRFAISNVDGAKTRFVFVVTPAGYRNVGNYYRKLPTDGAPSVLGFALSSAPETAMPDVTFVQITDTHVTTEAETLIEDLAEISRLKPAFIVATGDLTSYATMPEFDLYKRAIESTAIPVMQVIGNHDRAEGKGNYEAVFGPLYYSFDWGGCHFVVLDSTTNLKQQMEWLDKDLSMLAQGKDILAFWHYAPNAELMAILSKHGAKGIFTGHWHSNKTFIHDGVAYVNTPPLRFGGIDTSPRGFRLVTVAGHKMTLTDCYSGCRQHFALVSPANRAVIDGKKLSIRATYYDTVARAIGADYSLDGREWNKMSRSGDWGWEAGVEGMKPGFHFVRVRLSLDSGEELSKESIFRLSEREASVPAVGQDWPMFKGNAARTSVAGDTVKPPLSLSWSRNLGGTIHVSSPVTAHGLVYIGLADDECRGRSGVYALDARDGGVKWAFKTGSSIKHTVAVCNGRVIAAEVSGTVYALDAQTGAVKWQHSLGSGVDRWMYSSPLVKDGIVYVGVATSFVALNAETGEKLWQAETLGKDWISSLASPTAGPSALYIGFNWNAAGPIALNMKTGQKVWSQTLGKNWRHTSAAYSDGVVYVSADSELHALEAESGNPIWTSVVSVPLSSPAVSGSRVYVGSMDGKLCALDSATGKEVWSFQTGKSSLAFAPYSRDGSPVISSPVISGDTVYFGSTDGRFYAVSATTGGRLWSYDLGAPVNASPAVSGNAVYIASFDGTIYAFTESDSESNPRGTRRATFLKECP